jgi:hypothetical protein
VAPRSHATASRSSASNKVSPLAPHAAAAAFTAALALAAVASLSWQGNKAGSAANERPFLAPFLYASGSTSTLLVWFFGCFLVVFGFWVLI